MSRGKSGPLEATSNYDVNSDAMQLFVKFTEPMSGRRLYLAPAQLFQLEHTGRMKPFLGAEDQPIQHRDFLQAILNLAWADGLRPEGFADTTAEVVALRYHLEDMRLLAKVKR